MTNKYFTSELAKALLETKDDTIVIAYANQISDDTISVTIRDTVNNVHGLFEDITVNVNSKSVVVTIEATSTVADIEGLCHARKPATFKRSEFDVDELADHIMLVIKSYHKSRLENNEMLLRALSF